MIEVQSSRTLPVNPPGRPEHQRLTRHHVWQGLVNKIEDPVPYVDSITACTILERAADGSSLLREIVHVGDRIRENAVFEPQERIVVERLSGRARGTIINEINEDATGELSLTFVFDLHVDDIATGSAEEAAFLENMEGDYLAAVETTLNAMRGNPAHD